MKNRVCSVCRVVVSGGMGELLKHRKEQHPNVYRMGKNSHSSHRRAYAKRQRTISAKHDTNAVQAANGTDKPTKAPYDYTHHVSYAYGRVEGFLDYYAGGAGISRTALAAEVGELLRGGTRR